MIEGVAIGGGTMMGPLYVWEMTGGKGWGGVVVQTFLSTGFSFVSVDGKVLRRVIVWDMHFRLSRILIHGG